MAGTASLPWLQVGAALRYWWMLNCHIRIPERVSLIARFHRDGSRLHFELSTTTVGDQLRSYIDGRETHAPLLRDGTADDLTRELADMRADALNRGWSRSHCPPHNRSAACTF